MNKTGKIKVVEAFAGVGSQRMALRNLGIDHEVVGIFEIDKYALASYEAIHGECPNLGDIAQISADEVPDHDLFTYSFPCQDISLAGKQASLEEGSGTRSSLLWECRKIIEGKKPKYLLLENVKNLVGKKHRSHFEKWLEYLNEQGYNSYWKVLNAKDFGIPQNRERVFVVSILKEHDNGFVFEEGFESNIRLMDILESEVDEIFYISDDKVQKILNSKFVQEKRRIQTTDICGTLLARDYKDPKCVPVRIGNIYGEDKGTGFVGNVCDDYRVRKLTPKECWRLMGFTDDDFEKASQVCSKSQLYKQAGNSIVVPVLESIFKELLK